MDADFSVELGPNDPVLDFPWKDESGRLTYFDLRRQPELIVRVEEVQTWPELGEFLRRVNSARSAFESAKCDAWTTTEMNAEDDFFDASHKFASYVDVVFAGVEHRLSFPSHADFAKRLTDLLRRVPEIPSSAEVCVRRCFFVDAPQSREGFYFTVYVNGYGNDEPEARKSWAIGLDLVGSAILQLSASLS